MSILFCTPCYGGMVTAPHFRSCLNLKEELTRQGVAHDWLVGWNDSLITRIRNEQARAFLASPHSHLFWLDADIDFEPKDVAALWNLDADVGVGVYSMKLPDKPLSAWRDGKLVKLEDCPSEPFEVDYAGTGFMCIRRNVLQAVAAKSESYVGAQGRTPALFMTPIHDDGFESEDYNFCRRARDLGFKIVADPSIKLGHWGQARYGAA